MHDSYTPLGGMIPMLLMMLGRSCSAERAAASTVCSLFAILAVFIAGLMVGRTPEFIGKKIEPYEMKMGRAGMSGDADCHSRRQRTCRNRT